MSLLNGVLISLGIHWNFVQVIGRQGSKNGRNTRSSEIKNTSFQFNSFNSYKLLFNGLGHVLCKNSSTKILCAIIISAAELIRYSHDSD